MFSQSQNTPSSSADTATQRDFLFDRRPGKLEIPSVTRNELLAVVTALQLPVPAHMMEMLFNHIEKGIAPPLSRVIRDFEPEDSFYISTARVWKVGLGKEEGSVEFNILDNRRCPLTGPVCIEVGRALDPEKPSVTLKVNWDEDRLLTEQFKIDRWAVLEKVLDVFPAIPRPAATQEIAASETRYKLADGTFVTLLGKEPVRAPLRNDPHLAVRHELLTAALDCSGGMLPIDRATKMALTIAPDVPNLNFALLDLVSLDGLEEALDEFEKDPTCLPLIHYEGIILAVSKTANAATLREDAQTLLTLREKIRSLEPSRDFAFPTGFAIDRAKESETTEIAGLLGLGVSPALTSMLYKSIISDEPIDPKVVEDVKNAPVPFEIVINEAASISSSQPPSHTFRVAIEPVDESAPILILLGVNAAARAHTEKQNAEQEARERGDLDTADEPEAEDRDSDDPRYDTGHSYVDTVSAEPGDDAGPEEEEYTFDENDDADEEEGSERSEPEKKPIVIEDLPPVLPANWVALFVDWSTGEHDIVPDRASQRWAFLDRARPLIGGEPIPDRVLKFFDDSEGFLNVFADERIEYFMLKILPQAILA